MYPMYMRKIDLNHVLSVLYRRGRRMSPAYLLCFPKNTHFSTQHLVDVETVCTRSSGQLSSGHLEEYTPHHSSLTCVGSSKISQGTYHAGYRI